MTFWFVSSAVLLAALIGLRFLLRGRVSPALQYALWGLALLRLLIPGTVFPAPASLENLTERTQLSRDLETLGDVDLLYYREDYGTVEGFRPGRHWGDASVVLAEDAAWEDYSRLDLTRHWKTVLTGVWLAGVAAVGGTFLVSNLSFSQRLRRSRRKVDIKPYALPVYVCEGLKTPCLFGLFRPAVYITPEVEAHETKLRHVLAHEETHYRHGDVLWGALRGMCLALHWFDPLAWWAAKLSRQDAELCCDAGAIRRLGEDERADYGRTLIGLTVRRAGRFDMLSCATTMTGGKRAIKERVAMIAKNPKTKMVALIVVIVAVFAAALCLFTGAKEETEAVFQAKILEIGDGWYLVEAEPGDVFRYGGRATVPMRNMEPSPEPLTGDMVEVQFRGPVLETDPAQITDVTGIRVVRQAGAPDMVTIGDGLSSTYVPGGVTDPETVAELWRLYRRLGPTGAAAELDRTRLRYGPLDVSFSRDGELIGWVMLWGPYGLTGTQYHEISGAEELYDAAFAARRAQERAALDSAAPLGQEAAAFLRYVETADFDWQAAIEADSDDVMALLSALREYVGAHDLNDWEYTSLLRSTKGLDGAYAEGFQSVLDALYARDPDRYLDLWETLTMERQNAALPFAAFAGGERVYGEMNLANAMNWMWLSHPAATLSADLDHDGTAERILVCEAKSEGVTLGATVTAVDRSGAAQWTCALNTAHAGWGSVFLCRSDDGQDRLLYYRPNYSTGVGEYYWDLSDLQTGSLREGLLQFATVTRNAFDMDPAEMADFAAEVNAMLARSVLVASTDGGTLRVGPASAEPYYERFSAFLDDPLVTYPAGAALAEKLEIYKAWMISQWEDAARQ